MKKEDVIEKGKWQLGQEKTDKNGDVWVVGGFNAKGVPLWRAKNKKGKTTIPAQSALTQQTAAQPTTAPSAQPTAAATPAPAPQKQEAPYDAPKPKVQYKNNPESFGAKYQVPETWIVTVNSKPKVQERSRIRKIFADKSKYDDKKLLDFVNNPKAQKEARHLAWEEAAARGISEDKINISGTLKNLWKNNAEKQNSFKIKKQDDDEFGTTYNTAIGDFDIETFEKKFPKGDTGWINPKDPRVQKAFNKLLNLRNRQQYDAVVDTLKRKDPNYFNFEDQLAALRIQMDDFIESPYDEDSAIFISSGGAGAGKTYSLKELLLNDGKTLYDPDKHSDPTADSIDAIMVSKDIDNDKDFNDLLHKYNGKLIIFDDKDKLLVTEANKLNSMMKNIGDSNPDNRIIEAPDGKLEKFRGKLLFITNKTFDELNTSEDKKAILSRVRKNDIQLTLNENLELLATRYEDMEKGKFSKDLTPQQEKELRQEVYDFILDNVDKIDPFKFTVRKFTELMKVAVATLRSEKKSNINSNFDSMFGGNGSLARNWRAAALRELNKAYSETDIEKSGAEVFDELSEKSKERYKKQYKNNPKKFRELFGEKFIKYLTGEEGGEDVVEEDEEEEVIKGIVDDFGKMSIEEAQNILFQ